MASHIASPCRSSVSIQTRGSARWRRFIALPIAAPMLETESLADVRERIARAAKVARRNSADVALIAVSKTHPPEAIAPLIEAGQRVFGENRVQEAEAKWPALAERYEDLQLHLVGQLQSNKVEAAVRLFDAIHSIDRPSLVEALARAID